VPGLSIALCAHCNGYSIWYQTVMVEPSESSAPPPNSDMPDDVKRDYVEASGILSKSPRGTAALLRLAIQKLSIHLGQAGNNLNSDIAALVKQGLPLKLQQAADAVRVIGNNAVHPGQIDLTDDEPTATGLFDLVNLICDYLISQPKRVEEMYQKLPERQRAAIQERDEKTK